MAEDYHTTPWAIEAEASALWVARWRTLNFERSQYRKRQAGDE